MEPRMQALAFRVAGEIEIATIRTLAERIWRACYTDILSAAQMDYMLEWMYSEEVLRADLGRGVSYEVIEADGAAVGYLAFEFAVGNGECKLHKLYLVPEVHRRGIAQRAIEHVCASAAQAGTLSVSL